MWAVPPGVKKPCPAFRVIGSQSGARWRMTSPALTTEYSGPGWVCQPELPPGSIVTTSMWKSVGSERWMSMGWVPFPTASSLGLMVPDGGVAMAAVTPARLTTAHAKVTNLTRFMLVPPHGYTGSEAYDRHVGLSNLG